MAKSESEAVSLLREKLRRAVSGNDIIYVITDPEHVKLLPDGAIRILVTADLETIKKTLQSKNARKSTCADWPYAGKKTWDV